MYTHTNTHIYIYAVDILAKSIEVTRVNSMLPFPVKLDFPSSTHLNDTTQAVRKAVVPQLH